MHRIKKLIPLSDDLWQPPKRYRRLRSHPVMIPVVTFIGLLIVSIIALVLLRTHDAPVANAYVVIVSYDHHEQTVPSREPTVGALLQKLHIRLNEGDRVEPSLPTKINQEDFRINVYRAVPVEIVDGNNKTFTFSAATTPRSIARQAGIITYAEDDLSNQPVTNFVAARSIGEQVVIDRSTPVNINLYGALTVTHTHADTVGQLIREKHIRLAKNDQVTPSFATPLTPGTQVVIARNGTKLETVKEDIPMPVQTIQDDSLAFGTSAIRQQGSAGQKVTTYQDKLVNGQVVGRTPIQSVITQAAVTQIVVVGTSLSGIKGDMALAGIGAGDYNYVDYIVSHESGWCPTKAQGEHYCPATPDNQYTSAGYGLCQATPGSKMSASGDDWATNPVTQLRWCNGYAVGHYGSWGAAYNHWISYHWW
ncbi:MAG TPA: G5 domain-containing protein [Candidatus Saccharimonadales bacterium]|nr:G5 domain-containing protein [Candidatus Saccharimonadales bacterium]